MKIIIHSILITILLLFVGCNKNKIEREFYPDGSVEKEYHYSDGVLYHYKMFYPSGKLKYEIPVVNDLPSGTLTEYYENGSIKMQGTRLNNKEVGFYEYYNINQQIDSIIEYIPIDFDNPLGWFFDDRDKYITNASMRNRHVIYKNEEIDYEKSVYFEVSLRKDTVFLGDTVNVAVNFINQSNNQNNEFKIYFKDGADIVIDSFSEGRGKLMYLDFVAKIKGQQMLRGMIEEYLPTGKTNILFFEQPYYVK